MLILNNKTKYETMVNSNMAFDWWVQGLFVFSTLPKDLLEVSCNKSSRYYLTFIQGLMQT